MAIEPFLHNMNISKRIMMALIWLWHVNVKKPAKLESFARVVIAGRRPDWTAPKQSKGLIISFHIQPRLVTVTKK